MKNSGSNKASIALKLGKLAFDALKGAAVGGPHGALFGAAKGLIPYLIKPVLYSLLAFALFIVTFISMPSSKFGFTDASAANAILLTQQAAAAEELYRDFDSYTEAAASKAAAAVSTEGYDDCELTMELDPLPYEWVSAICSVAVQQELSEVNEALLAQVADASILVTTKVEAWEEETSPPESGDTESAESSSQAPSESTGDTTSGEGASSETETITRRRLCIHVTVLTADETMQSLGFDEFARQWAAFMYSNMTLSQVVPPGDGGSIGNLGDVVFREGATEVVYYNQRDERWAGLPYGTVDTIGEAACGPASLAMVISSLTGQTVTPPEMAEWAYQRGFYIENGGSSLALIPSGAKQYGLAVEGAVVRDAQKIVDALAGGKLIIAIMGAGHFTRNGHFLVLRGVTASGKILVADSFSYDNSEKEWDLATILSEVKNTTAGGGPLWIIG